MAAKESTSLVVDVARFLEAFRDAGYRGLAGALSELIDNSLEARASRVDVDVGNGGPVDRVTVLDNGSGIEHSDLTTALQLGGSTRFDSRVGFGRYGIGLPGSSISQARRVDVYTWNRGRPPWWTYLSLDAIKSGTLCQIPRPTRLRPPIVLPDWASKHGALVIWSICDRIPPLEPGGRTSLCRSLGRNFREALWAGRVIHLNGEAILPVDPLFVRPGLSPAGAALYGPPLNFDIDLPCRGRRRRAQVTARFSELPVDEWALLPAAEKRRRGITKSCGISILRLNREIDTGWFFMGDKRKESYDDWWRCEVAFEPELDEFFGVAHTKQGIHPRADLVAILTPHLARVAHTLNARVRRRFQRLRAAPPRASKTVRRVERRDHLLEPPCGVRTATTGRESRRGLRYEIVHKILDEPTFFRQEQRRDLLRLILNSAHPLHTVMYAKENGFPASELVELVLLAAARAERRITASCERAIVARHREHWSNTLAAFLA